MRPRKEGDEMRRRAILMNNDLIPFEGTWTLQKITPELAKKIVQNADEIVSFVNCDTIAKYMSEILGIKVPTNREHITPEVFNFNAIGIISKSKFYSQKTQFTHGKEDIEWYMLTFEGTDSAIENYSVIVAAMGIINALELIMSGATTKDLISLARVLIEQISDKNFRCTLNEKLEEIVSLKDRLNAIFRIVF